MITYKSLRELQRQEKEEVELISLSPDFFKEVNQYLTDLEFRKKELKDSEDFFDKELLEQIIQELDNSRKIIKDFLEHRERKILNKSLSNSRARNRIEVKNLTIEEQKLLEVITNLFKDHNKRVLDIVFDKKTLQKKKQDLSETVLKQTKVKIIDTVNEFIWSDEKTYGPFNVGDEPQLLNEISKFLVENKKAEII